MDYKINPKRLTIALVLFAALIVIGLISLRKPYLEYEQPIEQALVSMAGNSDEMPMEQASGLAASGDPGYAFIDLRNPYEFAKGHLNGAINIPALELLRKDNMNRLEELNAGDKTLVLYAADQSSVNGARQILSQLGISQVMVMRGGYSMTVKAKDSIPGDSINRELLENAWYDFNALMTPPKAATASTPADAPKSLNLKPKAAPKAAPAKQEEPQGC